MRFCHPRGSVLLLYMRIVLVNRVCLAKTCVILISGRWFDLNLLPAGHICYRRIGVWWALDEYMPGFVLQKIFHSLTAGLTDWTKVLRKTKMVRIEERRRRTTTLRLVSLWVLQCIAAVGLAKEQKRRQATQAAQAAKTENTAKLVLLKSQYRETNCSEGNTVQ